MRWQRNMITFTYLTLKWVPAIYTLRQWSNCKHGTLIDKYLFFFPQVRPTKTYSMHKIYGALVRCRVMLRIKLISVPAQLAVLIKMENRDKMLQEKIFIGNIFHIGRAPCLQSENNGWLLVHDCIYVAVEKVMSSNNSGHLVQMNHTLQKTSASHNLSITHKTASNPK